MSTDSVTTAARIPKNSGGGPWRAAGWVALSLVLFFALLLATLLVASRLTTAVGIGDPQREHFAVIQALLFGTSLLLAVPLAGRLFGQVRSMWPGLAATLPFLLAAAASYVIFEDVRSGYYFETDHALPEIFVPIAIALLGSAHVGHRVAAGAMGRHAWSWFSLAAAVTVLTLVAMTLAKAGSGLGGAYQLDSPLTFGVLTAAAAYAVVGVGRQLLALRR